MTLQDIIKYFRKISIDGGNTGSQKDTAYRLYNNAILLIKVGRFEEARRDLKDAVRMVPGFDDAYMLLGLTQLQLENRDEAINTINRIADSEKHAKAMYFHGLLSEEPKDSSGGAFDEAVGDVSYGGAGSREFAVRDAKSNPYANVVFDLEDESDANETASGNRNADKTDFKKRFEIARKNAEQDRVELEKRGTYTPLRSRENVRKPAADNDRNINANTKVSEGNTAAVNRNAARPYREDRPQNNIPAVMQDDVGRDEATADETGRVDASEKEKTGKGNKTVLLVLIIVISIALIAAISAAAIKLFHKFKGGKPSAATPKPTAEYETSTPTLQPGTTPFGTETATPGGDDPTATPGNATDTPTETPSVTEAPTETPKTPEQLAAEQAENLAAVKALLKAGDYLKCCEMIAESDWSYLGDAEKTELNQMKATALDNLSRQYKTKMYEAVKNENWADVLKYAEVVIKYNPDYSEGAAVYFHAAKGAELTGDYAKAERYYNETMTRFPDSKDAKDAKYRLDKMKNR